jgi:PAS domain S-box-containing protein
MINDIPLDKSQTSFNFFKALADNSPDVITRFDTELRHLYVSPSITQETGLPVSAFIGKTHEEMGMPEDISFFWQDALMEVLKTKKPKEIEFKFQTNEATKYYVSRVVPEFDELGNVHSILSIARDVTKRKINENRLRFHDQILSQITDAVACFDLERRLIYWNRTAEKVYGFSSEEALGKTPEELFRYTLSENKTVDELREIIKQEGVYVTLNEHKDKNEETLYIESHTSYLRGNNEEIIGTMVVIRDKTFEIKLKDQFLKSQLELHVSQERFRLMVEQSPLSKQIISKEGKIIQANKAFEYLYQINLEMLKDYNILEDPQLIEKGLTKIFQRAFNGETVIIPPVKYIPDRGPLKGEEVWTKSIVYPLTSGDGIIREIVLVHENITAQIKAEQKLEESLKEKVVLLKEIHHRVKNNLQIISSLLNLQSQYASDSTTRDILQDCRHRVLSMALVHERLYKYNDLSRINFKEYIKDLSKHLTQSYQYNQKNVEFHLSMDDILLDVDYAITLGLCLTELISNAYKHAFPYEQSGKVEVILKQEENKVVLSVRDNGIGIPKEFHPEESQSLGMQLINSLVGQVEGEIKIANTSPGTEFIIYLPLSILNK